MKTLADACTEGIKIGFIHARENPDAKLGEFLVEIESYMRQLRNLSDEDLRRLAGKSDDLPLLP